VYVIAVAANVLATRGIAVCKSTDGGLHWSGPVVLQDFSDETHLAVITADPADARRLYAIWDGTPNGQGHGGTGTAVFSRTTDGGNTWESPRAIVQPKPQDYVQFSQLLVLPNGTLVSVYEEVDIKDSGHGIEQSFSLKAIRSTDRGLTWSTPGQVVTLLPVYGGADGNMVNVDPETGQLVFDANSASITVDDRTGNIHAVWEDGRFSNFQYNEVAFSMSPDGGLTWSSPIRVNQTPLNIATLNRQAFLPMVAVAADGTIGVSYYDFRLNDPNPGLPTDRWLARCQPSANRPPTDPGNWSSEVRLTDSSFNMEACGTLLGGFYPGDYSGLAGVGDDFVCAFTQVDQDNVTAIFFRRVSR
jgi:Neuraminidase (sialidase)